MEKKSVIGFQPKDKPIFSEMSGWPLNPNIRKLLKTKTICFLLVFAAISLASGENHPANPLKEAEELNQTVDILFSSGMYEEAIPYAKRSLEIMEKVLDKNSYSVGLAIYNLADLYYRMGKYADAGPYLEKLLELAERILGEDHRLIGTLLNNMAYYNYYTGRYDEVEPLYKRSLKIGEKLGAEHPSVATWLVNFGEFYKATGRYSEAEPLFKKALEIRSKVFGENHPEVANSLSALAGLYADTGRYVEAEALYKRAMEIKQRVLGENHLELAVTLNNLALFYKITGRYDESFPLLKWALEMNVEKLGGEHPEVAVNLNNIAWVFYDAGMYSDAELLFEKSLGIREKAFGEYHPLVAQTLSGLAWVYAATSRHNEALVFFQKSMEITVKTLGKDHPEVARILMAIVRLFITSGAYNESKELAVQYLSLLERSLEILERAFGKYHEEVAQVLLNLAVFDSVVDKHSDGHNMFLRAVEIGDSIKENVFSLLPEKQKLNYMMGPSSVYIHAFISHTARYMQTKNKAVRDTFDVWLRWKGAVMEAQGGYLDAISHSENPELRKKFGQLTSIRREIARLQISGPGKMDPRWYTKRLEEIEKEKGSIEIDMNRLSKDFAFEKMVGRTDAKAISEVLLKKGSDSVYIDFANIDTYDFRKNEFSKSRYLAFILLPDKEPVVKLIDISNTEEVDIHVRAYLNEMKRAKNFGRLPREKVLREEAKAIHEALIKPLESYIKGKRHLYISPDGNLNLIPFEVLMTPEGKYLMEDHLITYVATGRDIMRFMDTVAAKGDALIMADPDYDMGLEEKERVAKAMEMVETRKAGAVSRDAAGLRFDRLPDTKIEADAIEKILRGNQGTNVRNYQDKKALEEVLLSAKEPRILHLSTHGYFLRDEEIKSQVRMRFISQELDKAVDVGIENPMLRSGIVLAGVNASLKEGRDDGIVSAEKILGLNLKGTDLVVLSACETGVGDVKSGEGVFGLKRSFILSGAKTVVMSLWSVPSKETAELMTDFYTMWAKGGPKADAFQEARLKLMKKKSNPFYWGAFVMVGNPN